MDVIKTIPGDFHVWPPKMEFMDVSGIKRKWLDVPYGKAERQKVDIYLPDEGDGPFPAIVFIHGGAFYAGDRRDVQALHVIDGIRRGYAVVSVGQRLAGEVKYPLMLFDFKCAVRFLRANAVKFLLDGDRFASAGDSAGGFYCVMAAATQDNPAFEDLSMGWAEYSSRVKAVVSWFGIFDFLLQVKEEAKRRTGAPAPGPDIFKLLFGARPEEIEGLMHFASVYPHITGSFPHLLLIQGTEDSAVPVSQARTMNAFMTKKFGPGRCDYWEYEGYQHGGFETRWHLRENQDRVFQWLDSHV